MREPTAATLESIYKEVFEPMKPDTILASPTTLTLRIVSYCVFALQ